MSSFIKPKYRPDIDGLRAIAILSVVAFHAFPQWCKGGFIGVDIFFVISGYLISKIILDNLTAGSFSFTEFYFRRIRRIFPALILVLITSFTIGWLAFYPEELTILAKHIFSGAGFFSNFTLIDESGYFDDAAITKPLLHLWSLGVEEQFYLLWPPLLVFLWKKNIRWLLIISLLIFVSFAFNAGRIYPEPKLAFYSPFSRFWELWVGAALAWVSLTNQKTPNKLISNGLSLSGAILLFLAFWLIDKDSAFPGFWALLPVIGAALIIAGGQNGYINKKILANPILVWIGLISFPLYLWHWLLISSSEIILDYPGDIKLHGVAILISFILAWLTYKFIEKPIRDGLGGRVLVGTLFFLNITIGCFAAATYFQSQKEDRLREESIPDIPIPYIENNKHRKIMLIGDSHAGHLSAGLKRALGESVRDFSTALCLPLINISVYNSFYTSVPRCLMTSKRIMKSLQNDENFDTVIMSHMGPVYLTGEAFRVKYSERIDGLEVKDISNEQLTDRWVIYELALRNTLREISSYHKKIIFVLDIPEIGSSPKNCKQGKTVNIFGYAFNTRKSTINNCLVSRQDFENRIFRYRVLVNQVLKDFPEVVLFDPTDLFCDEKLCYWNKNGRSLYKDTDHLSQYGSEYIAQYLVPVIAAP